MVNKARVNKLNKQRQEEKEKAKAAESDANKTDESPANKSAQGEQEVDPEDNIVDTGDESTKKEEGKTESTEGNDGASAEKPEEKVSPSPAEEENKESHTEL